MPSAGKIGNFWLRVESSIGASSDTWSSIRTEAVPVFPTNDRVMVENSSGGYNHPYKKERPVAVDLAREASISFASRIRRQSAKPPLIKLLESGGWSSTASEAGTISSSGTDTLTTSTDVGDAGSVIGIECTDGLTRPSLISSGSTSPYTLATATPVAHQNGGSTSVMYASMPKTSYSNPYNVASGISGATVQFRYISGTPFADDSAQNYHMFTGCALASIGAIEIGAPGTIPLFDMTFHGFPDTSPGSIAALDDDFLGTEPFGVVSPSIEFQYGDSSSGPATTSRYNIETISINLGITTVPVYTNGSGSTVGGISGYISVPAPPTITITTTWESQAAFERGWFASLDTNTTKYMHIVQPTSSPGTQPMWGFFIPKAHIDAGGEPTIDYSGDVVKATATFTCVPNYSSSIESMTSAPIFFAVG